MIYRPGGQRHHDGHRGLGIDVRPLEQQTRELDEGKGLATAWFSLDEEAAAASIKEAEQAVFVRRSDLPVELRSMLKGWSRALGAFSAPSRMRTPSTSEWRW